MFDFQKLNVYQKSRDFCIAIQNRYGKNEREIYKKLVQSSLDILLNIAVSSTGLNAGEKMKSLSSARGKVYECGSLMDLLKEMNEIDEFAYFDATGKLEEISAQLTTLIHKLGG